MSCKSPTKTLSAAMRVLARDIQSGDGVANAAISEAADRLEEQQARIAELEHQVAIGWRAVDVDRLHKLLAEVEGKLYEAYDRRAPECCGRGHGECCGDFVVSWTDADNATMDALSPVRKELAAILREAEQANNRAILDSSDHVGDATKMVTDRQLADAVNELRDIAIKYHAAGQLRERIAVAVHGLVRGEPATVAVDVGALGIVRKLVEHIERNTCAHDSTHRAGFNLTVCDQCGIGWADDQGGKPEFQWPPVVVDARRLLAGGE